MKIKRKDIISIDLLGTGHSELSHYYVMGVDEERVFVVSIGYLGYINGVKHPRLRSSNASEDLTFYSIDDLVNKYDCKIINDKFEGFKQVSYKKSDKNWTEWVNVNAYDEHLKKKKSIESENLTIIKEIERFI